MSLAVGVPANADLDLGDLKSPSSQESGLGTMIVIDESLGSLEELSEDVHQHLNSHIDHARLLQYELDLLRAQLAEKNRLISTQQMTIKQLQDTLNASQREINDFRRAAEAELTCKSETINILQSDLAESQQQYAECFQQVVNQDRVLSEMRDDDTILIQKIAYLESQLCKSARDMATQTIFTYKNNYSQPGSSSQRLVTSPPHLPKPPGFVPSVTRPESTKVDRNYRRSVHSMIEMQDFRPIRSPSPAPDRESFSQKRDSKSGVKDNDKSAWIEQFQDLLLEIRQLQNGLKTDQAPAAHCTAHHRCSNRKSSDVPSELLNTFAEEKQHRLQLEHNIRLMEIELIDLKNQIQKCSSRMSQPQWNYCGQNQSYARPSCCPCAGQNSAPTSLYTLV